MGLNNKYVQPIRVKLKSFIASIVKNGFENGSDKFSTGLFLRKMFQQHFALFLYFLICFFSFIDFVCEYSFGAVLLFLIFCISVWLCTSAWERRFAAFSLVLLTILDYHFAQHYNRVLHEVGNQALVALHITDPDEITTYLRTFLPSEVILYAVLILALILLFFVKIPERLFKSGFGRILPLALFLFGFWYNVVLPYNDFLTDWREKGMLLQERAKFSFHAEDKRPGIPQQIFLIIGETHRHDHFDLLTNKKFAPVLHQLRAKGKLLILDDIITCYQTTFFSVASLLTRRGTDNQKRFYAEKGLIDLYKEAGYHTIFITYCRGSLENDVYNITLRAADEYINYRDYGRDRLDRLMIPICQKISQDPTHKKLLVVIKMIGAHFYYQDRYTKETMLYHPSFPPEFHSQSYDISMKEKICNSYKNAVLESSVFLNGIADVVAKSAKPSMIFFISDHGCTNYDDGKNPFIGGARENYHVPCFFYFNDSFLKILPEKDYANLKKNAGASITNSWMFDTMVSLSGINYPSRRPSMDLTSPSFKDIENRMVWQWNDRVPYNSLKR